MPGYPGYVRFVALPLLSIILAACGANEPRSEQNPTPVATAAPAPIGRGQLDCTIAATFENRNCPADYGNADILLDSPHQDANPLCKAAWGEQVVILDFDQGDGYMPGDWYLVWASEDCQGWVPQTHLIAEVWNSMPWVAECGAVRAIGCADSPSRIPVWDSPDDVDLASVDRVKCWIPDGSEIDNIDTRSTKAAYLVQVGKCVGYTSFWYIDQVAPWERSPE